VYKPARSKLKTKEGGPLVAPLETDDLGVKAKPSLAEPGRLVTASEATNRLAGETLSEEVVFWFSV
jgi:hypothetical protein